MNTAATFLWPPSFGRVLGRTALSRPVSPAPTLPVRRFKAGDREILLRPDASRSVLDASDDLRAVGGGVLLALFAAAVATRWAMQRALAPLAEIDRALASGTEGRFDQRLPVPANYEESEHGCHA